MSRVPEQRGFDARPRKKCINKQNRQCLGNGRSEQAVLSEGEMAQKEVPGLLGFFFGSSSVSWCKANSTRPGSLSKCSDTSQEEAPSRMAGRNQITATAGSCHPTSPHKIGSAKECGHCKSPLWRERSSEPFPLGILAIYLLDTVWCIITKQGGSRKRLVLPC